VLRTEARMKKNSLVAQHSVFYVVLCAMLFALCSVAEAQQPKKVPHVGYLTVSSLSSNASRNEAFRQGMRELGYVEGKNIVIEWRSGDGKVERKSELVAELVRLRVDVIVTSGPTMTRAAQQATATIPIVMAFDPDPVGNGFIASLARPGRNITGLSSVSPELSGKQLELLKEIVPQLSRVAVLGTSAEPGNAQTLREIELAAEAFAVKLQYLEIADSRAIGPAFRAANKEHAGAMLVLQTPFFNPKRKQIAELALQNRLPAIYPQSEWVDDGGLMSYGVSFDALYQRAATYVDKILKGTKPADIPVEQPTKFEFLINLKAAKQIGLTIPPDVLARADKVIR
jgi:putative tryptophan/tyrosine transport system substrate-binding protein